MASLDPHVALRNAAHHVVVDGLPAFRLTGILKVDQLGHGLSWQGGICGYGNRLFTGLYTGDEIEKRKHRGNGADDDDHGDQEKARHDRSS